MRARLGSVPAPLAILLVIATLQAVAWATVTAPLQGPDEDPHVSYVTNLVERGRAPSFNSGDGVESRELGDAIVWANLRALIGLPNVRPSFSPADEPEWHQLEGGLDANARKNAGGPNSVGKNPPLYYAYEALPYLIGRTSDVFDRIYFLRLGNGVLFVITVGLAWLIAAQLWPDIWRRTALAGFIALQPQLASMAGAVNPDTMLTLIWTAFVLAGIRLLKRGPSFWRVTGLIATVVASALTQGRGLPLIGAGLFVLALAFWRNRPVRRDAVAGLGAGAAIAAGAYAIYKLTLAAASNAYSNEISFRGPRGFDPWEFVSQTWQFYLPRLPGMDPRLGPPYGFKQVWIDSLWGSFGSLEVRFPHWTYNLISLSMITLLIGLIWVLWSRRRTLDRDLVAFLGVTCVLLVAFLHLASYRNLLGTQDPLLVGRYLMPLLAPIGLAVIAVCDLLPRPRAVLAMTAVLSLEMVLCLSGLAITLARFYG